jgi:hypothetical protein
MGVLINKLHIWEPILTLEEPNVANFIPYKNLLVFYLEMVGEKKCKKAQ